MAQVETRAKLSAPALRPPRRAMDRFVGGFAFTPTPDQDAAFADIAAGLARLRWPACSALRPMLRGWSARPNG